MSEFLSSINRFRTSFDRVMTLVLVSTALSAFPTHSAASDAAFRTAAIQVTGNGNTVANGSTGFSVSNLTDFGSTSQKADIVRSFDITNTGSSTLTISNVAINDAGGYFSITSQPASTVAAGGSTSLQITFDAESYGVGFARITISSNDPSNGSFSFYVRGVSQTCWTCNNIVYTAANVCSGHGTCTGTDACVCHSRYAGSASCDTFMEFEGGFTTVSVGGSVFFALERTYFGPLLPDGQTYTWKIHVESYSALSGKPSALSIGLGSKTTPIDFATLGSKDDWGYESVTGALRHKDSVDEGWGEPYGEGDFIILTYDPAALTLTIFKGDDLQGVVNLDGPVTDPRPAVSMVCQRCVVSFQ